jgi:hypothetical protein
LDGAAEGAEAVRMIVGTIRELYEQQEFNFATTASSRTTPLASAASPSAVSF